jgi:predicted component of type VI protein secretion system
MAVAQIRAEHHARRAHIRQLLRRVEEARAAGSRNGTGVRAHGTPLRDGGSLKLSPAQMEVRAQRLRHLLLRSALAILAVANAAAAPCGCANAAAPNGCATVAVPPW